MSWALRIGALPSRTTWLVVKLAGYIIVAFIFVISLTVIQHRHDAKLLIEFQALREVDPLPEARQLVAQGRMCDALEHLEYFLEYDYVKRNPEVVAYYDELRAERESYLFRAKDILDGIWKGKGACLESMLSATAADFLVVGDLRDLALEGLKAYRGEDVDAFVVGLASVGVVLAGVTYGSAGGAAPAKGVTSLLKVAKRLDKIPKSLQKQLTNLFSKAARSGSVKPLKPFVSTLSNISQMPGVKVRDVVAVVSRTSRVSDLAVMEKMTSAYGKRIGKFLTLGGDTPVRVFRKFGSSKGLTEAMDEAIKYGARGTRLIEKTGPTKFMRYLKLAKYGARGTRSAWQGRFVTLSATVLKLLPEWLVFATAGMTGLFTLGVPIAWVARRWSRHRGPGKAAV